LIVGIESGGPAEKAGLKERDILVELDGHTVETMDDLHRLLNHEKVGVECQLTILRRSEKLTLKVTPVESIQRALPYK